MRWFRNPVVPFLVVSTATLAAVVVGTASLSAAAADDEAIADARRTTAVLAGSVAEPLIPAGLVAGDPDATAVFDATARARLLVEDVQQVKIWSPDGRVLWSDESRLVGSRYALDEEELAVLEHGGTEAELSDLSRPENRFERDLEGGLLEVYTRVEAPGGEPLLFEVYYSSDKVALARDRVLARFRPVALGAPMVLVAVTTPLLLLLTRRVTRGAAERERLLQAAVRASDAERVRIARDLHDGVVQDLAGSSYALATASGRADLPAGLARELEEISRGLRTSMRSLRSLLIEIYPPDLHSAGLGAALTDLLAPVEATGVRTSLVVTEEAARAPGDVTALVWRVAQEAVRNAARHARAASLAVHVGQEAEQLTLTVEDDGAGFDPEQAQRGARFGLRGLDSLVREAGGALEVCSAPARGTTVRLEVPVR